MPCSHFRGTGSAGFIPPLAAGTGGFTLNGLTVNRFTVNGFTVNGFILPVDRLRRGRSRKPFRMRRYEKCACKCPGIGTYKNKGLKLPWNQHLQKKPGGGAPPPGHSGHPQTVALSNTGSAPLNIASITLAAAFPGDRERRQREKE